MPTLSVGKVKSWPKFPKLIYLANEPEWKSVRGLSQWKLPSPSKTQRDRVVDLKYVAPVTSGLQFPIEYSLFNNVKEPRFLLSQAVCWLMRPRRGWFYLTYIVRVSPTASNRQNPRENFNCWKKFLSYDLETVGFQSKSNKTK